MKDKIIEVLKFVLVKLRICEYVNDDDEEQFYWEIWEKEI